MLHSRKSALLFAVLFALNAIGQDTTASRVAGAVKSTQGNVIALKSDDGSEITINVTDSTRIVRTADLKTTSPAQLTDIQAGDRITVRGAASDDHKTFAARSIVLMKQSDVAARQKKEEEDWQRNGVFGPVKSVDPATGAIVLAPTTPGGPTVTVQTSKDTIVRQYAPDSPHFDDAKLSSLAAVKPGDQLRARGTRAADPSTFTAKEIVFGSFRNVAGTISSIDTANQTVTVNDLSTKKPVVVKITSDSQMRKLPQQLAMFIALRLRGGDMPGAGGQGGQRPQGAAANGGAPQGGPGGPRQAGPGGGGMRMGGDPMQMLARLPQVPLTELQKGDALMIVTTQGTGTSVSAITLLAGVEPILTAPNAQSILSPWNLGAGGAAGGESQ